MLINVRKTNWLYFYSTKKFVLAAIFLQVYVKVVNFDVKKLKEFTIFKRNTNHKRYNKLLRLLCLSH